VIAIAANLADRPAQSAVERDQVGGHAATERAWIRESGLLTLSIPEEFGGQGMSWATILQIVRFARHKADSALAHVFRVSPFANCRHRVVWQRAATPSALQRHRRTKLAWGNALESF
jgi:alkylation response protein AidB-like acyl-CoA dehydrogenase